MLRTRGLDRGFRRASSAQQTLEQRALAAIRRNNGSAWYVTPDYNGIYTDSLGELPADAPGAVVGLATDRSYGPSPLGPEMLVNGDFRTGVDGWLQVIGTGGDITWTSPGVVRLNRASVNVALAQTVSLVAGRSYMLNVSALRTTGTGNMFTVLRDGSQGSDPSIFVLQHNTDAERQRKRIFTPTVSGTYRVEIARSTASGGGYAYSASVREVLGNLAKQETTANKPVIATLSNGKRALAFDGSNDLMNLGGGSVLSMDVDHWASVGFIANSTPAAVQVFYCSSNNTSPGPIVCQLFMDPRARVIWRTTGNTTYGPLAVDMPSLVAGRAYVMTAQKNDTTGYFWLDGVLLWSGSTGGTPIPVNTASIGASVRDTTVAYFNGSLAVAAGSSTLSGVDRVSIERLMAHLIGATYAG